MTGLIDLATTLQGDDLVAHAAHSDGTVTIWSIRDGRRVSEFRTVADPGGRRIALCSIGDRALLVAGSWDRGEVSAYDARTGERSWFRDRLGRPQTLSAADSGHLVAISRDDGPMTVLESSTGETKQSISGARDYWQNPRDSVAVVALGSQIGALDTEKWRFHWKRRLRGFGVLDVAFADNGVAIVSDAVDFDSDERASVRCFNRSGELVWQHDVEARCVVPWVGWNEETREWLGIEKNVDGRDTDALIKWAPGGLARERVRFAESSVAYVFVSHGRLLLDSTGRARDTASGAIVDWPRFPWRAG
jgi:outer membrane protein assembly factor BamB